MRRVIPIVLSGVVGFATVAHAANCSGAVTQMDMNACAAAEFQAADARLNATYQEVAGRLRGQEDPVRRLAAAERAWVRFRDAECEFETNQVSGGSIAPMVLAECRTELTRRREGELRGFLNCREGDVACPLPPK
jgi:uncharacterized protein YecT (DUF1311 family)